MVRLTVFLVRDGETAAEVRARTLAKEEEQNQGAIVDPTLQDDDIPKPPSTILAEELSEDTVNDDLKSYISNQAGDKLTELVDPELTNEGYWQAQDMLATLMEILATSGGSSTTTGDEQEEFQPRKIAFFTAPNQSCSATAFMMGCADISRYTNLTWRLNTLEGASAPQAIPIVVSNGLCNNDPHVQRLGGYKATVEGGLMHCAAQKFNDGRDKCPMMKVVNKMKHATHDTIDDWDEALDENGKRIHHVNYVQYVRMEQEQNPWSLKEMIPKVNIVVDYYERQKYMLPPRKGWFDPKDHYDEWNNDVSKYVKETIWLSRQAGCDTVVMVVPGTTIQCLAKDAGYTATPTDTANDTDGTADDSLISAPPCCVASVIADVDDDSPSDSVRCTVHHFATDWNEILVPPFTGEVNELMSPPEDNDPANAPVNKWALFPEPFPEIISKDYPKNLPPFSECLDKPLPDLPKRISHRKKKVDKEEDDDEPIKPPPPGSLAKSPKKKVKPSTKSRSKPKSKSGSGKKKKKKASS